MSFSKSLYSSNSGVSFVSPPYIATYAPASTNIKGPDGPFPIGQLWVDKSDNNYYVLTSLQAFNGEVTATWVQGGNVTDTFLGLDVDGTPVYPDSNGLIAVVPGVGIELTPGTSTFTIGQTSSTKASFLAVLTGSALNVTGNGTDAYFMDGMGGAGVSNVFDTTSSFNVTTGAFTAPVAGTYLFVASYWTTTANDATQGYCNIVVNTTPAKYFYFGIIDPSTSLYIPSGNIFIGGSLVIQLAQGDTVTTFIKLSGSMSDNAGLAGNSGATYFTSFAGSQL